ncbi:MAG: hypothetical protein OWS03_12160 [Alicyclobacillaceae bacterium]|uniref:hypothetical protein n=1 Tax=Alicyclobacillus sp. SP_1 TaxID=2942475 RepID=UPI0021578584|nr:hypothetical protein [Alicyclobacillus sp. SP_1]MCY0897016.1 hypothetical protein [Alicyclobacillaceae bacterium]
MSFFKALKRVPESLSGSGHDMSGAAKEPLPEHECDHCHVAMEYKGPHAIRTGGLSRKFGLVGDVVLGVGETIISNVLERNVAVHVFVCQECGRIEMINDPKHGF